MRESSERVKKLKMKEGSHITLGTWGSYFWAINTAARRRVRLLIHCVTPYFLIDIYLVSHGYSSYFLTLLLSFPLGSTVLLIAISLPSWAIRSLRQPSSPNHFETNHCHRRFTLTIIRLGSNKIHEQCCTIPAAPEHRSCCCCSLLPSAWSRVVVLVSSRRPPETVRIIKVHRACWRPETKVVCPLPKRQSVQAPKMSQANKDHNPKARAKAK